MPLDSPDDCFLSPNTESARPSRTIIHPFVFLWLPQCRGMALPGCRLSLPAADGQPVPRSRLQQGMEHCSSSSRQFMAIWIPSISRKAAERDQSLVPEAPPCPGLGGRAHTSPALPLSLSFLCSPCSALCPAGGTVLGLGCPVPAGPGGLWQFVTSCVSRSSLGVILHVLVLSFRALKVSQRFHYPKSLSVSRRELFQ